MSGFSRFCAACGAAPQGGLLTCASCHGAVYCGPACQRAHWKTHKIGCKSASPALFDKTMERAEDGDPDAQLEAGLCFLRGIRVPKSIADALKWLRLAAGAGVVHAQYVLGDTLLESDGALKDPDQGITWLRRAAEAGHVQAQSALAQEYLGGGSSRLSDRAEALFWYRRAAEGGDVAGQLFLGAAYSEGHGVPKDQEQAAAWFLRAAKAGCSAAQVCIGTMYATGTGVAEDLEQAEMWLRRAAAAGNAEAQAALATLLSDD